MGNTIRFFAVLAMLLLSACSATSVHLYTEGIEQPELAQLQAAFQEKGFKLELNARPVPQQVEMPTLVYSPYHENHEHIEQLSMMLAERGYTLNLVPVSIGNNFYTANNVGLYLKPYAAINRPTANANVTEAVPVPADRQFNGECPAVDAYLLLTAGHTFTLDILGWNDRTDKEVRTSYSGTWEQQGEFIRLSTETLDVMFRQQVSEEHITIRQSGGNDRVSMSVTRLLNPGAEFSACNFVARERVQL